jgi:hypothetical protein
MYKVIHFFTDLQDNGKAYSVGDIFPRTGVSVSEKRLKELATVNNKQGKPLIELVRDVAEEESPKKRGRKASNED